MYKSLLKVHIFLIGLIGCILECIIMLICKNLIITLLCTVAILIMLSFTITLQVQNNLIVIKNEAETILEVNKVEGC